MFGAPTTPAAAPAAAAAGTAGASPFDMSQLLAAFNTASPAGSAGQTQASPTDRFANQLTKLNEMGFTDTAANLRALQQTNGNVNQAVERLLG